MQRPLEFGSQSKSIRELVAILGLTFFTWYLAELSNGFLDFYALISLVPALVLVVFLVRLWSSLQRERDLRRHAEEMLRASRSGSMLQRISSPERAAAAGSRHSPQAALTEREVEVLTLIASSCTNQRIGEALSISLNTVERHTANIYRKLGVRGRVEATHYAVLQGLVTEETVEQCRERAGEQ